MSIMTSTNTNTFASLAKSAPHQGVSKSSLKRQKRKAKKASQEALNAAHSAPVVQRAVPSESGGVAPVSLTSNLQQVANMKDKHTNKHNEPAPVIVSKSKTAPDATSGPSPRITRAEKAASSSSSPSYGSSSRKSSSVSQTKKAIPEVDQLPQKALPAADFSPAMPPSAANGKKVAQVSVPVPPSASARIITKLPYANVSSASVTTKATQPLQKTPTDADFPATLPATPPELATKPSASYAAATKTPPQSQSLHEEKASRASPPTSPSPVDDIYNTTLSYRRECLRGVHIVLLDGNEKITHVPKAIAMAASTVLNEHFTENPKSLEYHFEAGSVDPYAVRHLMNWLKNSDNTFQVFPPQFRHTFKENVALLRAARLLGMERYTKHILGWHVRYLKYELPQYHEISIVEEMATSMKDPLYTSMVNGLAHTRFKHRIPDPVYFNEYLEEHPRLKKSIEEADEFFGSERRARQAVRLEIRWPDEN